MTAPSPSTCGGGAGGGLSEDILSATLFDVGFEDFSVPPLSLVRGTSPVSFFFCVDEVLLMGRAEDRLDSAESGEGPCALVRAHERTRSRYEGESIEASFIDVNGEQLGSRWSRR